MVLGLGFGCLCCVYRGAWRGWAESAVIEAAVTHATAADWQSAAADKTLLSTLPADR